MGSGMVTCPLLVTVVGMAILVIPHGSVVLHGTVRAVVPADRLSTALRSKALNNRAENPHQPTRRRERIMKHFTSARHLKRFVSIHDRLPTCFRFSATA
jgi:transposase-like protein